MYEFKLSRKRVSSQKGGEAVGYNYYLVAYIEKKLVKEELLHTSLGSENPLASDVHDGIARNMYRDFLATTEKLKSSAENVTNKGRLIFTAT